ncbi:MAG: ATP-independent RNA helicase DbpA [Bradymonadia bacterium]|jgi:ATP-independent RNA helicase DbpA
MPILFDTLPLRPELQAALVQIEYTQTTPIQAAALPPMLRGEDVTGQAETGSGKTAAFGLALLNPIHADDPAPQALVLCPTRELAEQVGAEIRRLGSHIENLRVLTLCGGQPKRLQTQALAGSSQVIVGTPGRIADHLEGGTLCLDGLRGLVLDEADRMLEMGFIEQVEAITTHCPKARQTLLFSATFPDAIVRLSARIQTDAQQVAVQTRAVPEGLRQLVFTCAERTRGQTVLNLLGKYASGRTLVFCETRADCDGMASLLKRRGVAARALHGQMEQRDRNDAVLCFLQESLSVLVATNVAARGLDMPALPTVIIAELSHDPQTHLHRVGRTGRAGAPGLALSLVATPTERRRLDRIEAYLEQPLPLGPPVPEVDRLTHLVPPNRTLLLMAGRKQKLRKGDVLGALIKDAGLPADAIGRIDLTDTSCAVAIAHAHAPAALAFVQRARIKKTRVRALLLAQ